MNKYFVRIYVLSYDVIKEITHAIEQARPREKNYKVPEPFLAIYIY